MRAAQRRWRGSASASSGDVVAPLAQRRHLAAGARRCGSRDPRGTRPAAPPRRDRGWWRRRRARRRSISARRRRGRSSSSSSTRSSFACSGERQLADLVEEERAAVRRLELAAPLRSTPVTTPRSCRTARPRAARGDRRAVDGDEGPRRAAPTSRGAAARRAPCRRRSRRAAAPAGRSRPAPPSRRRATASPRHGRRRGPGEKRSGGRAFSGGSRGPGELPRCPAAAVAAAGPAAPAAPRRQRASATTPAATSRCRRVTRWRRRRRAPARRPASRAAPRPPRARCPRAPGAGGGRASPEGMSASSPQAASEVQAIRSRGDGQRGAAAAEAAREPRETGAVAVVGRPRSSSSSCSSRPSQGEARPDLEAAAATAAPSGERKRGAGHPAAGRRPWRRPLPSSSRRGPGSPPWAPCSGSSLGSVHRPPLRPSPSRDVVRKCPAIPCPQRTRGPLMRSRYRSAARSCASTDVIDLRAVPRADHGWSRRASAALSSKRLEPLQGDEAEAPQGRGGRGYQAVGVARRLPFSTLVRSDAPSRREEVQPPAHPFAIHRFPPPRWGRSRNHPENEPPLDIHHRHPPAAPQLATRPHRHPRPAGERRALAQLQTGNLYGNVTDEQGAALPGVTVTLTGRGAPQVQVTNAAGRVPLPRPAPGSYGAQGRARGLLDPRLPEHHDQRRPQHHDRGDAVGRGRGRDHGHRRVPAARRAPDLHRRHGQPDRAREDPDRPRPLGRSCSRPRACSPTASTSAATRAASSRSTSAPAPAATRRSGRSTAW